MSEEFQLSLINNKVCINNKALCQPLYMLNDTDLTSTGISKILIVLLLRQMVVLQGIINWVLKV